MTEEEVRAIFYTHLTTQDIEKALELTNKQATEYLLATEVFVKFGLNQDEIAIIRQIYEARSNLTYFSIHPNGMIMIDPTDPHDYPYLELLLEATRDGYTYLAQHYDDVPSPKFRELNSKPDIAYMADKFKTECVEIAKVRAAQDQIGFPPERLTMLRNMLDGMVATILGDEHFLEWAKQITGMVDVIVKLEGEFKLDSD